MQEAFDKIDAAHPEVVWEVTTDGDYTIGLTGWQTDGGYPILLPIAAKAIIHLSLSADGVSKHAFLVASEVA